MFKVIFKVVENNPTFVLKNVFNPKISKTFDCLGQKSNNKKLSYFSCAFTWNHPKLKNMC